MPARDTSEYRDVTIEELISHPAEYRGQKIRVGGYLVLVYRQVQLLDSKWTDCYGNDSARDYLTTKLPLSVLGEPVQKPTPFGREFAFHGRLATVVGTFEAATHPWGDTGIIEDEYPYRAAGPLVHAKVASMDDASCTFRADKPDPQP